MPSKVPDFPVAIADEFKHLIPAVTAAACVAEPRRPCRLSSVSSQCGRAKTRFVPCAGPSRRRWSRTTTILATRLVSACVCVRVRACVWKSRPLPCLACRSSRRLGARHLAPLPVSLLAFDPPPPQVKSPAARCSLSRCSPARPLPPSASTRSSSRTPRPTLSPSSPSPSKVRPASVLPGARRGAGCEAPVARTWCARQPRASGHPK